MTFNAVLEAVRAAPPPAFSGGGKWEAMHGTMAGYYGTPEELAQRGFDAPQIVVINGMVKPNAALFNDREYKRNVRDLGADYRSRLPRRIG